MSSSKPTAETISTFVKQAIDMLVKKQVSETVILSSYKINTVLKNFFGREFKVDRIGRALARIAKNNKLKRISTRIPKYIVRTTKFKSLALPD
jgi:hypothetical protein